MSLALKLPSLNWPGSGAGAGAFWHKHHWALLGVGAAFCFGLIGANFYSLQHRPVVMPEAALAVGPMPLPLVAGVDPIDRPLPPAPAPGLEAAEADGKLPIISASGHTPLEVYAYPFDRSDARPRISIVLMNVGMQTGLLREAVRRLPGAVTLAFNPYTANLGVVMADARHAGHETLMMIPGESTDPVGTDPGPQALRSSLQSTDNIQRLHLLMGRSTGYVGLVLPPDTALLNSSRLSDALLEEARTRGLALAAADEEFLKAGQDSKTPVAALSVALDSSFDPADLEATLGELEQRAREGGRVVAYAALYPFVIDKLAAWLPTLYEKGLALAPFSASVDLPVVAAAPASEEGSHAKEESAHHEEAPAAPPPASTHH